MILSAKHIDDACRSGLFCWIGNRQRVTGCQSELNERGKADPGKAWVCIAETREWEQVPLTNIVIENRKGESNMPAGKGAPGRVTHIKSKKRDAAKPNNDNLELPGVEVDQRKVKEIEDAEEARQAAVEALNKAHEELEEARLRVVKAMHKHGFDADDNPLYMRNPWGGVVLTATGGEVKESVKFVKAKAPKSKKDEEE